MSLHQNPRIIPSEDQFERLMNWVALASLLLLIIVPVLYYSELPDEIPIHFGFLGEPDRFGDKSIIWILPIIGIGMYVGLRIVARYPHKHNYLVEITEANAENQYRNGRKLVLTTLTFIILAFLYITFGVIQVAFGNWEGLGNFFLPIFLVAQAAILIYFLMRSRNLQ